MDFGGEIRGADRVDINTDLNNETMLMLNRPPPLTGENRNSLRSNKTGNHITVLKEGKSLDEDKITPFSWRGDPSRPTPGDLWDKGGAFPLTKFIVLIPVTDNRKPGATDFFVYVF